MTMLLRKEMTTQEIEYFIKDKSDFVKIDLLGRLLNEHLQNTTRKFVFLKLGEIYERVSMFSDSASSYEKAVGLSTSKGENKNLQVKAAQLFIRAGDFNRAEGLIRNAISDANNFEKKDIADGIKKYYIYTAEINEKLRRLGDAVKLYEKIMTLELSDSEKKQIKEKLMFLYDKLGKIREYMLLKNA
jgi:tetratricopeptide (TPR) repeat protein